MAENGGDPRSDEALLEAVATGDRVALEVLYRRHVSWLMPRLSRRCNDADLVDQAIQVQDTFVVVWQKAGQYGGRGEVGAWLWGIAIRRLIDRLRRQRPSLLRRAERDVLEVSAEDRVLAGVEHGAWGARSRHCPELRAVIQASVLDGLTTREAARLLGVPTGTIKTRAMRARAHCGRHWYEHQPHG